GDSRKRCAPGRIRRGERCTQARRKEDQCEQAQLRQRKPTVHDLRALFLARSARRAAISSSSWASVSSPLRSANSTNADSAGCASPPSTLETTSCTRRAPSSSREIAGAYTNA